MRIVWLEQHRETAKPAISFLEHSRLRRYRKENLSSLRSSSTLPKSYAPDAQFDQGQSRALDNLSYRMLATGMARDRVSSVLPPRGPGVQMDLYVIFG